MPSLHSLAHVLLLLAAPLAPPPTSALAQDEDPSIVETRHPDGSLEERFTVDEEGRKNGAYERFRTDGTLEVRATYAKGALDGTWTEFDANGARTVEGQYRRGARDGFWRTWAGDVMTLEARYKKDELHGDWHSSTPDGAYLVHAKYTRGALHGRYVEERPAEEWERTAKYDHGVLDGKATLEVGGKTVSRRRWKDGVLVDLDGRVPYPVAEVALRAEIGEALVPADADPEDAIGADRQYALARLKAYRALCRLPWREMTLVEGWNELCDAASEVCEANGELSHTPPKPPGFDEARYRQGYEGASKSNLAAGGLRGSVDSYMDDSDPSNIDRIGHRRWCLNPAMGRTGFGASGRWAAMWSLDDSGKGARGRDVLLYPPEGYVPTDLFGARHAWSVHFLDGREPKAEDVVVRVVELDRYLQARGEALEFDWNAAAGGGFGGSPCWVFRPVGVVCQPGRRYGVEISLDGGKSLEWEYLVEFVAPMGERGTAGR